MRDLNVTVDPGLGGTGIAVWKSGVLAPIATTVVHAPDELGDFVVRTRVTAQGFQHYIRQWKDRISIVHVEYPGLHTTAAGYASAAGGAVFKLMFLVGAIAEVVWSLDLEFAPLPVNDWKSTMSKDAVGIRVCARLECEMNTYPNHTLDAVGMGLFLKDMLSFPEKRRVRRVREEE